jgi:pantoate--beta-alanine ligase
MIRVFSIHAARRASARLPRPLALVPTMGALHAGHAELIRRARKASGPSGSVAVSIFVNPLQFGPGEDFKKYPRPLSADLGLCRVLGVDMVFLPAPDAMYAPDASVRIEECSLSLPLCGHSRPGHFSGVCTVVAKLFNILAPEVAVFGEKDWQQLAVIRRMVRDLNTPVRILAAPTVREADGLALSSRNRYLSPDEREAAGGFAAALRDAATSRHEAVRRAKTRIARIPSARIDYLEARDAETLAPLRPGRPGRLLAAVFIGKTRLIDNLPLPP